jgi:CBS domain-containing protein
VTESTQQQLVRDAMVPAPFALPATASAREAAEALERAAVRAVLVCDDGRLTGVITRKTLVREIVAAGRDPQSTPVGAIAEPPNYTIPSDLPLDEGFAFLEAKDLERVPVVDDGRLVGVLSRAVVQRRLYEDEPPPDLDG